MRGEAGKSTREADVGREERKDGIVEERESLRACLLLTARERNRSRERVLVMP